MIQQVGVEGRMAPRHSYLSHLECGKCARLYDADAPRQVCECGSPLLARYDLASLRHALTPSDLAHREPTLWRYHELLPVRDPGAIVTLGEGMTPLVRLPRLGERLGLRSLYMKDEGLLPTGTFKARGAAVGISRALELGIETIAMPTNGNAGAAWAAYAARAGIAMWIVMPKDAPAMTTIECTVTGAHVYHVNGLISDAGRIVARAARARSWFDGSTLKEPYRIEGKKTMGLEIAEQLGWAMPDVIIYPTGGGVGVIGIYKALLELRELGWVSGPLPRLVAVQASGCAPIVRAWRAGAAESEFWEGASTIAFGLTVPKALGDFLVLRALYETSGCAVAVDDADLVRDQELIASLEGAFPCLEGAATVTALRHLLDSGWIGRTESVVLLNTGAGLKFPSTSTVAVPILDPNDDIPMTVDA
ncbi:MAG TPA: threonine synthase [Chloroflexota bacterium]